MITPEFNLAVLRLGLVDAEHQKVADTPLQNLVAQKTRILIKTLPDDRCEQGNSHPPCRLGDCGIWVRWAAGWAGVSRSYVDSRCKIQVHDNTQRTKTTFPAVAGACFATSLGFPDERMQNSACSIVFSSRVCAGSQTRPFQFSCLCIYPAPTRPRNQHLLALWLQKSGTGLPHHSNHQGSTGGYRGVCVCVVGCPTASP
ncbi:hypothetical protein B0T16DRAFT_25292 [Cercophora newfieldiana]|uniref:Uncharacterized protein n=1 Tax=Cercophora newfieldiana TaxID=92897 RepID=A0AA40D0G5_9PEZI|nr:hypothetical protein B0T16DRAFT_25292 [Cercophora newfieldiana]